MAGTKGNSGRPKKPTQLKIIQGTFRPDRANPNEPQPNKTIPIPPKGKLSEEALAEYFRLAELVNKMQVLTEVDGVTLELCAQALEEYYTAKRAIKKNGLTHSYTKEDEFGNVITVLKARPEVAIASDAWRRASSMLARFGLDPASRARVSVNPDKKKGNKWENL